MLSKLGTKKHAIMLRARDPCAMILFDLEGLRSWNQGHPLYNDEARVYSNTVKSLSVDILLCQQNDSSKHFLFC